ncbi:uncharacterized protein LOC135496081 [Lineus longissimus]|uniref:uncharacterized protein LOC135496081 n=1 Tax=Lineus longissimus TaxID=88925 RepID=UPI00315C7891
MSNFSRKSIADSGIKRSDNVPVTSFGTPDVKQSTSIIDKMDTCLDSTNQMDFYESDLMIAQYTQKLRAEDLKIVTSIPKVSFDDEKGTLDTPEVSLNLSDFIDTPELNKFTTGEGLFPQVDLLTSSQEDKSNLATTKSNTVTTSHNSARLVPVKQEPIDVVDIELGDNSRLMSHQTEIETIDIASYMMQPQSRDGKKLSKVVVKQEVPEMGTYVTIPESTSSSVSEDCRSIGSIEYDYIDNVPTPVHDVFADDYASDNYQGKSPPPSKGIRKHDLTKGSEEYKQKRERNNVAVRKSREKARERQRQTEQKVKTLSSENKQLSKKLELVTKELTVLRGLFSNANLRGLISPQHKKLLDKLNQ